MGIMINLSILYLIPENNFAIRSILITTISVLSILYFLFKSYSTDLSIKSDFIISVSSITQFLLPVLYLALHYKSNSDSIFAFFRFEYAMTSFAILLAQTCFFIGYESVKQKAKLLGAEFHITDLKGFIITLMPLTIIVWISRFILLASGSYYHINRTNFQYENIYFSGLSQINSYGLVVIIAFFLIANNAKIESSRRKYYYLALFLTSIELLWYGIAGSREPLIMTILAPFFVNIFYQKKIRVTKIVLVILIALPLFLIWGEYRYTIKDSASSEINIENTFSQMDEANYRLSSQNWIEIFIERFYDGKSLGFILMNYGTYYQYEFGDSYKNLLYLFIPRFFYPSKPIFTLGLKQQFMYGSMPTTIWGEAYLNFSWMGIIFISFLLGVIMKGYDNYFIKKSTSPFWLYIYIYGAINMLRLPVEPIAIWFSFLLKIIILAFLLNKINDFLKKGIS